MNETKPVNDERVMSAMVRYGGGFISKLGQAAQRADDDNLERIKKTWPEAWEKYTRMAALDGKE